ncbi:hypothetical protein [Aeromicrobium sp. UC242_57]|uniref:hypothetical protein n=1 Tax=Aeromicrobium sp. UC242_57 TaxID=3374624 RepID=UPI0037B59D48
MGTGGLIKCWDELLVGQKLAAGSCWCAPQTRRTATSRKATSSEKGDTLIFAIDLLDAAAAS